MKRKLFVIVLLTIILMSTLAVALLTEKEYESEKDVSLASAAVPEFECVMTPAKATNPVGTQHRVFVTVTQNGVPVPGTYVRFIVVGVNSHVGPYRTTNQIGQTDYIYTSNGNQGQDIIFAVGGFHQGGNPFFCRALKRWI